MALRSLKNQKDVNFAQIEHKNEFELVLKCR